MSSTFLDTLPDGWTIYLWLVIGAMIIVAAIYWIRWGMQNEQFDEDIKYVIFDAGDKDKMAPEEFAKSEAVMKSQMESRVRHLAKIAESHTIKA
jgi:nitrogen fixation-related uncharacterized protein